MSQTILVVDDEVKLREMARWYLEREGYRVVEAANGRDALFVARSEKPDLVLLDLMMPEMGGYDFIRNFTQESDTPIIVLTARLEESDKVVGLELGADDYVTKPFGVQELIARVRAVLRRVGQQNRLPEILRMAEITLDRAGRTVRVSGNAVALTPSEYELLETFMLSPGRAFSRLDLLEAVSGDAYEGYERTIDVHIRNLRTKIEPVPSKPRYIQTVYGMGYRFAPEG
ncbi:MAG: response regulator transcription factor [Caldilineaceae bacterium]|nr:response regulator transcription factor [Caldilineaceae bacterium]MDE0464578.1 response regulator transcription factor [Caldilineaceae bacterium]MXX25351.1 response regulator transcription factor [Caldilineaceae bacterium SB0668_bin_21]MYC22006.1 response regulator transcription factor [Caldilineaceae bacterium SB0662_bin_25]